MIITMSEPEGSYSCEVDTGDMRVEVRDLTSSITFITPEGNSLILTPKAGAYNLDLPNGQVWEVREIKE